MKNKIKLISLVMAFFLLSMTACSTNNNPNGTEEQTFSHLPEVNETPVNTVIEEEKHYVENLHKVNVQDSNIKFIVDGETDYKIIIPAQEENGSFEDSLITEAANFIVKMAQICAHANIQIQRSDNLVWNENCKWIIIGCDDLFESANLTIPTEINNDSGYYIKTVGNSVFMKTIHCFGYQYAAVSFLTNVLGYDYISNDMVVFSKDGSMMPEMEIIEQSDYEYKFLGDMTTNEAYYGMGFNVMGNIYCNTDGVSSHNVFELLPKNKYQELYPEWYSKDGEQLCFTAHGDEKSFNTMVTKTVESCAYWLSLNEGCLFIPIVMEDGAFWCDCDCCKAEKAKYGTDAAVYVKFANAVSKQLNEYLASEAEKNGVEPRVINVLICPYSLAEKPPVKTVNGKYVPVDDSVILGEHVYAYIAPANASYTRPFYDDKNSPVRDIIKGWKALSTNTNELFFWLYETNYSFYLYPFNSYEACIETFRYCYEEGAIFMYSTSQYNNFGVTGFSRFKDYIDSKLLFDLNLDFNEVADNFFTAYFRDAAPIMRTFFDEMQLQLKYIDDNYCDMFDGQIFSHIEREIFWPKKMLDRWIELTDEAQKAIEKYKTTDNELYNVLSAHIKQESISPRYIMLKLYSGFFTDAELNEFGTKLKSDCAEMSIYRWRESQELDAFFAGYGV